MELRFYWGETENKQANCMLEVNKCQGMEREVRSEVSWGKMFSCIQIW